MDHYDYKGVEESVVTVSKLCTGEAGQFDQKDDLEKEMLAPGNGNGLNQEGPHRQIYHGWINAEITVWIDGTAQEEKIGKEKPRHGAL
jgi:hypothetical protein